MSIMQTNLKIGASVPARVLHIADTHLVRADLRDGERKVRLSRERSPIFPQAEETLANAMALAAAEKLPILHAGDLIDFVSVANLEAVRQFTDTCDCFLAAGNHEFSLYVGEAVEDAAYRNQSLGAVQDVFRNDIRASARVIGGVNFVALDNGYYLFEQEQLAFLKAEVARGLPVVLLLHTPLYEPRLYERMMQNGTCAYLVAVPEAGMQGYSAHRYAQQRADVVTLETVEYIHRTASIKAILAGHLHFNYEGVVGDRIPQIITSCTDLRIVTFD